MSYAIDVNEMNLDALGQRCAEETSLFFRRLAHDSRYCFEMFRRALDEGNQKAWQMLYAQYRGLVAGWVARHPELETSRGEVEDFTNRAFERMWAAWTPDKFRRFGDLRSLLAYLKMCTHSAILDEARRAGPPALELPSVFEGAEGETDDLSETGVMEQERSQQLWELVNTRLRNEKERVVVQGLFVLDLKPRAIYAQYPDIFHDMKEIYRTRQVVLERLGRDPGLKDFLSDDA